MDNVTWSPVAATRLRRLADMSLAEIRYRGRQEGAKWIERFRAEADSWDPRATLRRHAPRLVDPGEAAQSIRHTFDQRFFRGASVDTALRHDAAHVDSTVREADALLEGRFDLLGYRDLSFGAPIDWHLDPVWSRRSPVVHWSQIDALDPAQVGDSKVVWELNRHQWMVRLAQASLFTGKEKYGEYALGEMIDWIAANPAGRGINWASSLEVSLRLMSWTWTLALLRHTELLSRPAMITVLASLHAHASHVLRYMSCYFSPNTHLTGEALGLFYAGCMYPQFAEAEQWRDAGSATLVAEVSRQISIDGVYFEQSTCYQRYTCDIYLHYLMLAERAGVSVRPHVIERVSRAIEFLSELQGSDGSTPDIGDADGGWLMPLCYRKPDDCRGTLSVAATVLNRSGLADPSAPEPLWLNGARSKPATPRSDRRSRLFSEGGYAILRSREHELILDVGPLGSFGHGHADLLSIQCSVFGERCLIDAGTYGYTAEPEWRDYFRSSGAHSTVTLVNRSQALPRGPFGWQSRPSVTVRDWQSTPRFDLIDAEHHAYPGITHRRRVVAIAGGSFMIVDDLLGDGEPCFELTFQFAPMPVVLTTPTVACATTRRGHQLWVSAFSSAPLTAAVHTGRTNPIRGWVSLEYGRRVPAPSLVYSSHAALPVRVITMLYPR